jgi:hypothetical protein
MILKTNFDLIEQSSIKYPRKWRGGAVKAP